MARRSGARGGGPGARRTLAALGTGLALVGGLAVAAGAAGQPTPQPAPQPAPQPTPQHAPPQAPGPPPVASPYVVEMLPLSRPDVVLGKDDGWREGLWRQFGSPLTRPDAVVEIAYSPQAARRAWQENRPVTAARRSLPPTAPGVYGSLDDVDLGVYALVVFSSGQSGTCPEWLADLDVVGPGTVVLGTGVDTGGHPCHADLRGYRMVLAVDRARLPSADRLPSSAMAFPGRSPGPRVLVRAYPGG